MRHETRIGAVMDILCDRFCAAAFYFGLIWLQPEHTWPVLVYLAEFMVLDCFLSLAFLAWPLRSPNYFYAVDRTIWALELVASPARPRTPRCSRCCCSPPAGRGWRPAIASALLVLKSVSLARLARIGLPDPGTIGCRHVAHAPAHRGGSHRSPRCDSESPSTPCSSAAARSPLLVAAPARPAVAFGAGRDHS